MVCLFVIVSVSLGVAVRPASDCRVGMMSRHLPSPVRVVEVVGVADQTEGVIQVAVYHMSSCAIWLRALQSLGALSSEGRAVIRDQL